jgi:beta-glucosidase
MSMVTEAGQPIVAGGAYTVTIGGGQPDTGAPTVSGTVNVSRTVDIAE